MTQTRHKTHRLGFCEDNYIHANLLMRYL